MRKIIHSPSPRTHSSESFSSAIMVVDAEPIRQSWIKRYYLLEQKLENLKRDWREFEEGASAEYQRWYYTTFASELAHSQEISQRIENERNILAALIAFARVYELDELEAYRRVKERLNQGEDPFPPANDLEAYARKEEAREEAEARRRAERMERFRREEDIYRKKLNERVQSKESTEESERKPQSDSNTNRANPKNAVSTRKLELKSVYRVIVRELHPDLGHEMSPIEKDWWNQAQNAYKSGDLEFLRILRLKIEGSGSVSVEKIFNIGTLIELCQSLLDQQLQIKDEQRSMRKDPIYRFWSSHQKPSKRENLRIDLLAQIHSQQRSMKQFIKQVRDGLQELEEQLDQQLYGNEEELYESRRHSKRNKSSRGRSRGQQKP